MFNNCDEKNKWGSKFFLDNKDNFKIIFDVGCRINSLFLQSREEVHYFDPNPEFIEKITKKVNNNSVSYFNSFGLGSQNNELFYFPKYESFINRIKSCKISDDKNKILLKIRSAKDYIKEKISLI